MSIRHLSTENLGIRLGDVLPDARKINHVNQQRDVLFQSCCGQWDECQAGDVYVAVVGSERDGHDYAMEAVQRGAKAVVGERLMAINRPQYIVEDSRTAYGLMCQALAGSPCEKMATIGVSGTDGKTVTSHLIQSVLNASGAKVGLASTIETNCGRVRNRALDELNSPTIAETLSRMVLGGCTHSVVETPSISLAQRVFAGTQLDVAVLTNIRTGNLDYHGNKQNYLRNSSRILDYLRPTGFAVLNADDRTSNQLLDELDIPVISVGIHQAAEVRAKIIERSVACQTFMLSAGSLSMPVRTKTIGKQHIYNCLNAAAVGLALGMELETIVRGLETATIPGRLERVDCGQPFGVWIDSAKTPSQLAGAIAAVGRVAAGNVWCVCSTDDQQTPSQRKKIGEVLERAVEQAVITSSKVSKKIDYEPAHQILDGYDDPARPMVIPNRLKAIEWTLANAKPEDAVLVTGCGERPIAVLGDKNWALADRDVCEAWLYDNANQIPESQDPDTFNIDDYR